MDPETLEALGLFYMHQQDFELAEEYFLRSLEANPSSPQSLREYAYLLQTVLLEHGRAFFAHGKMWEKSFMLELGRLKGRSLLLPSSGPTQSPSRHSQIPLSTAKSSQSLQGSEDANS